MLRPGEPRAIVSGDVIRVGQSFLLIRNEPLSRSMARCHQSLAGHARLVSYGARSSRLRRTPPSPCCCSVSTARQDLGGGRDSPSRSPRWRLVTIARETLTVEAIGELFARASGGAGESSDVIDMASAKLRSVTLLFDEATSLSPRRRTRCFML